MLRLFLVAFCYLCLLMTSCGGEITVSLPGCEDCPEKCLQETSNRGRCVTCLTDIQCRTIPRSKKICTTNNKCICGADTDCPKGLFCAGPKGCLTCMEDKHCPKNKPVCSNNYCVACEPAKLRACQPEGVTACKMGLQKCKQNGGWDECKGFLLCSSSEICKNGKCEPKPCFSEECKTRQCGIDKCGQSCGTCKPDELCNKQFRCGPKCIPGGPCTVPNAIGSCAKSVYTCDAQNIQQCLQTVKPKKEECTGKDDDCDGSIDNIDTFNQPCKVPKRKGACQKGIWGCLNNQRTCVGTSQPQGEICDGLDNDCDGKIDNNVVAPFASKGYGVCSGTKKICKGKSGWQDPDYAQIPGYQATETWCDNRDNDCDAKVDEGFPTKGNPCTTGQGICQRQGQIACKSNKLGVECQAISGTGTKEVCNGQDDDCDGKTDENLTRSCYLGPTGTLGVGVCKQGSQTCTNGKWPSTCPGQVIPVLEVCNNKDDNCDGKVDNLPNTTTCCKPTCTDGPEVTINTLNYKGMSFYPLHLDKCTSNGACCKPSTTKEQMDAFCRLAGKCRSVSWVLKTIKNSTKCYCWGSCTKCIWFPNCCAGMNERTFVTSVKCR